MAQLSGLPAPLGVSDALDIVHDLACLNRIDPDEAALDGGLEALARWQGAALDTVADLLFQHGERLDALFPVPLVSALARAGLDGRGAVPDFVWGSERDLDPGVPSHAVRIVLALAPDGVLEPGECDGDPVLLAGAARAREAIGLVRLFVATHGDALDLALSGGRRPMCNPTAMVAGAARCRAVVRRASAYGNVVAVSFRSGMSRPDGVR